MPDGEKPLRRRTAGETKQKQRAANFAATFRYVPLVGLKQG